MAKLSQARIPCFICGDPHTLEDMGSYFKLPDHSPAIITAAIDHPSRLEDTITYKQNVIGICTPCQRAILSVRRAQGK